jgi:antitoxin ChpS
MLYLHITPRAGIIMHTTNLRKVGGSVMLAVPPVFLEQLRLQAGASVGLIVRDGQLVVEPSVERPRYDLDELIAEAKAAGMYPLKPEDREWLDAPAVGREIL